MGKIKSIIEIILPPIILIMYRKYLKKTRIHSVVQSNKKLNDYWNGSFTSWASAEKLCKGYDSENIINKCFEAIQKISNGQAVYERDSVLFEKKEYSLGIIASIFIVAKRCDDQLSILDFGGSLGTTYFQNLEFLSSFKSCNWTIVEQEKFYQLGKKHFENNQLNFLETINDCLEQKSPNLFLISSSLQYISNPIDILNQINKSKTRFVVFDRVPFSESENIITIQTVPSSIYDASYPCWIFNYNWLLSQLTNYKVLFDFPSYCDADQYINDRLLVQWKGITLELID